MGFWQLLTLGGTMATILGVFLTFYAMINNRTLKEESKNTREVLLEESKNTRDVLLEESKHTREILLRIEQGQAEARRENEEARREVAQVMAEARKEMAEAIKGLGGLIRSEGEQTRDVIRARSA